MSCAALLCLVGVYAEGSIDMMNHAIPAWDSTMEIYHDKPVGYAVRDRWTIKNPYGRLVLGAQWQTPNDRFELFVAVEHQSSIVLRDRGEDLARVGARVWLWRAKR